MPAETRKLEKQTQQLFGLIVFLFLLVAVVLIPNLDKFAERLKHAPTPERSMKTDLPETVVSELTGAAEKLIQLESERQTIAEQFAAVEMEIKALPIEPPKITPTKKTVTKKKVARHKVKLKKPRHRSSSIQSSSRDQITKIWSQYCKAAVSSWGACSKLKG